MHRFWPLFIRPLLQVRRPKRVVIVAAPESELVRLCRDEPFEVSVVTPLAQGCREPASEVIDRSEPADVYLLDGDRNYFAVYHELVAAERACQGRGAPLVFCHDADGPLARRDLYLDPTSIPTKWRKAARVATSAERAGHVGRDGADSWIATREDGPRNGVLTAIEDFISERQNEYEYFSVPGMSGLGVVVHNDRDNGPLIARIGQLLDVDHVDVERYAQGEIDEGARRTLYLLSAARQKAETPKPAARTSGPLDPQAARALLDKTALELQEIRASLRRLEQRESGSTTQKDTGMAQVKTPPKFPTRDKARKRFGNEAEACKDKLQVGARGAKLGPDWVAVDLYDKSELIDYHYDLQNLPIEDATYDRVVCNAVLEHLPYPELAIYEMGRILRPGGEIWIEIPFLQAYHAHPYDYWRCTLPGIRIWMHDFDEVEAGIFEGFEYEAGVLFDIYHNEKRVPAEAETRARARNTLTGYVREFEGRYGTSRSLYCAVYYWGRKPQVSRIMPEKKQYLEALKRSLPQLDRDGNIARG